jgi:DNA processing protein
MSADDFRAAAHVAALAGLPGMGPATLVSLLRSASPEEVWLDVQAGRIRRPPPRQRGQRSPSDAPAPQAPLFGPDPTRAPGPSSRQPWADAARRTDPLARWEAWAGRGIGVTWPGQPDYPTVLATDPEPPGALFWMGDIAVLERPCVAIVGTRNATPDGRAIAFQMGHDLAAAGICVVSGLALGIDGASHAGAAGAVEAGAAGATVGVAASGVDVPYPTRHTVLWRRVTAAGAVLSENLPGRPAQAWRFPSRNRIIAGLVRMVVVVESHQCGGSLITAEAAIERGVDVRVVPGPVHSPASAGSNQLLYDGPGPVRHAQDVLDALGLFRPVPAAPAAVPGSRRGSRPASVARSAAGGVASLGEMAGHVLEAMGWRPVSTGQVMARAGLDAASASRVLDDLEASGCISCHAGRWVRTADGSAG